MIQELLKIPFTELTVKSYGTMLVLGFMAAAFLMRRLSRRVGIDPLLVTNAALYSLISGVIGARIFFVLHHLDQFSGSPLEIFAIWGGGWSFWAGWCWLLCSSYSTCATTISLYDAIWM